MPIDASGFEDSAVCDRCGKDFVVSKATPPIVARINFDNMTLYECALCDDCAEKLYKFFKMEDGE